MKKIILLFLILSVLVVSIGTSSAAVPAPYTLQAKMRLDQSEIIVQSQNSPPVGATPEETVKYVINFYKKVFEGAGYSLEKSIVQYSNDLNKDPDFVDKGWVMAAGTIVPFTDKINKIREDIKLKSYVDKLFSHNTITALDNILTISQRKTAEKKAKEKRKLQAERAEQQRIEKENELKKLAEINAQKESDKIKFESEKKELEAKEKIEVAEAERRKEQDKQQKELESIKKQNTLKILSGHYENQIKEGGKSIGSLDIKIISEDKAIVSINTKKNFAGQPCKMDNKEFLINIEDTSYNKSVDLEYGEYSENNTNKYSCAISAKFKKPSESLKAMGYGYYVEVETARGCKSYCGPGGTMMGRYLKIE